MAKDLNLAIRITAKDSTRGAITKTKDGIKSISNELRTMRNAFIAFQGVLGLQEGIAGIARVADAIQSTNARLRLAVSSVEEYARAQQFAYQVAAQTGAGYEAVATLYAKLARTAKGYGLQQEQIARITETTALALKVSGATAAEAEGAVRQFAQALGSGVLRGDEFNSMMEQAPRLMQALAAGLGLPIGKLRSLAEQGLLTTDVVVKALESQGETIKQEAESMPRTIGQAVSKVGDQFGRVVDKFNQASGASRAVGAAMDALANSMEAIVGTGIVAAVGGVTVALTRAGVAAKKRIIEMRAEAVEERRAIQTAIEHARAKVAYAQAELRAAQATVASATGMARLAAVQNTLIPAQQRLAAAQAGLNAAMTAGARAAGVLRAALAFVGGPLGLILTLLSAGATAWALWGDSAKSASDKAKEAIDRATAASERLRRAQKYGTGDAADLREAIAALEKRKKVLEETVLTTYRGNPTEELRAQIEEVTTKLERFKEDLATIEKQGGSAAPGGPTEVGRRLLRKQWDAYIAQYETGAERLKRAIADLKEKAKAAGISETSTEFQRALANLKKKLGESSASGADRGRLAAARARSEAELAVLKDGLQRQQRELDAALEDRLLSIRDYYKRKTAIEQQEIDAEIARQRQELERQKQALAGADSEKSRQEAKAKIATIEAELIILSRRRADVEVENARKATSAEETLAKSMEKVRNELAQITGSQTAEQRQAAVARAYENLRKRLVAESDTTGVEIVDRLINVKAAQANLAALERQWRVATERLRNAQEAIRIQQQAGLITETRARREIVALNRQAAAELERMLPSMERAASAIGPEAVIRVQAWRNEIQQIRLATDELAPIWNDIGRAFGQALDDMTAHAKTWQDALSGILISVAETFRQNLVIKPFQEWVAVQAKMLAAKLGFIAKDQAMDRAASAATMATKSQEAAATVSMEAAKAGAGAAASKASIPYVGPALAMAAMAAMVAAVMGLMSKVKKYATGGLVTGPGTATSDSIPARLSAGEYVVNAAAVRKVGIGFLDAINGGSFLPRWRGQTMAFATGGVVPEVAPQPGTQAAQKPQVNVRVVNAVDEGVIGDFLATPGGEEVITNVIRRNAATVRQYLGD